MVGLYILAEGETERTFVSDVLKPNLSGFGIDFTVVQLPRGHGMKGGIIG